MLQARCYGSLSRGRIWVIEMIVEALTPSLLLLLNSVCAALRAHVQLHDTEF